jgi:hypothetical protein
MKVHKAVRTGPEILLFVLLLIVIIILLLILNPAASVVVLAIVLRPARGRSIRSRISGEAFSSICVYLNLSGIHRTRAG